MTVLLGRSTGFYRVFLDWKRFLPIFLPISFMGFIVLTTCSGSCRVLLDIRRYYRVRLGFSSFHVIDKNKSILSSKRSQILPCFDLFHCIRRFYWVLMGSGCFSSLGIKTEFIFGSEIFLLNIALFYRVFTEFDQNEPIFTAFKFFCSIHTLKGNTVKSI